MHPGNVISSANNIIPSSYDGINDQYFMDCGEQYEILDFLEILANLTIISLGKPSYFLHQIIDVSGYKLTF